MTDILKSITELITEFNKQNEEPYRTLLSNNDLNPDKDWIIFPEKWIIDNNVIIPVTLEHRVKSDKHVDTLIMFKNSLMTINNPFERI